MAPPPPELAPFCLPLGEAAEPVRRRFWGMACELFSALPPSGFRTLALGKLEWAMLWTVQAVNAEART